MFILSFLNHFEHRLLAKVSRYLGILSVSVWLFAQLPQILENHMNQSVSGVSLTFLICWMLGDATNLLGCILTQALPFQTSLASYYCFIDLILAFQYWYYTRIAPHHRVPHNMLQSPTLAHAAKSPRHLRTDGQLLGTHNSIAHENRNPKRRSRRTSHLLAAKLLGVAMISVPGANGAPIPFSGSHAIHIPVDLSEIGKILAWLCSCFYLLSRIPQIVKNYRLKSTKGISIFLFALAMTGNFLYTASIVTNLYLIYEDYYHDDVQAVFWDQLPFVIGSFGTVIFDAVIICQKFIYRETNTMTQEDPLHFKKPHWYTSFDSPEPVSSEQTRLLSSPRSFSAIVDPPQHYVLLSSRSHSHNSLSDFFSNNIRNSFKVFAPSSSGTPSSIHASAPRPIGNEMSTSLIPSIVESYSSVSKKMLDDSKVPFLPIDFLGVTPRHNEDKPN